MIPQAAVNAYLTRALDSHAWIKRCSAQQLADTLARLDPPPQLHPALFRHQLACILLGVAYPQFCFWNDMGTGKTAIVLELLRYRHQCGQLRRALICVTSDKAFSTWEKQIARFEIDVPYVTLEGSSQDKWRALERFKHGLVIAAYPGLVAMVSRNSRGRKWILDPGMVARLGTQLDALVMDESTKAAGYKSLTHALMRQLRTPIRYALAGRPFGRDPTLLWAQHFLVDGGETLGPTLGLFRAAFFTAKPNYFGGPFSFDYVFKRSMQPHLARMVGHRSITYAAEECIDLPKLVPSIEEVRFAGEAWIYYRRAVDAAIAARGNLRVMENLFLRMRQLSSGFVGFKDDATGERAQVEFDANPKFDRLMELLEDLPPERKACVFYEFTYSGRKIAAACAALKLKPIWLWSGTKDYKGALNRFETDPSCRVAIVQSKVGAYSLDGLQVANYLLFYESPVSVIDREQAERRIRRQGQRRTCFQYDLVVRGSVDGKILAFHKQGEELLQALLRNPAKLLAAEITTGGKTDVYSKGVVYRRPQASGLPARSLRARA